LAPRYKRKHQDDVREKIQASQLVNRLTDHVHGRCTMDSSQVRAADILLKKVCPDLSDMKMDMTGNNVTFNLTLHEGDENSESEYEDRED
jgi:hypothetical protein